MRADILVTTSPYSAKAADDGAFSLREVAPGAYSMTIYAREGPVVRTIDVKNGITDLGIIQ